MRISPKIYPLLVLLAGGLAYVSSFNAGFVFDDSIVQNDPRIRHILPVGSLEWFRDRPFVDLTFALNYTLGRLIPSDYHATNVVVHLLAGLLLYGIVRRTLSMPCVAERFRNRADMIALWASAVWIAHPLTTSAVTYVCQRYESVMGMFYLLALYALIRGASSSRALWPVASLAACALGMASKEVMLTAPFVLLIYDRIFLSPSLRDLVAKRLWLYVAMFVVCLIVFLPPLTVGVSSSAVNGTFAGRFTWFYYGLTQCSVIRHYIRLALWPHPLCLDYFWLLVEHPMDALPDVAFICSLILITILLLRYRPGLGFLGVWFFAILAPTSSIVFRPDCAFEHRMYLPLIAVAAGFALIVAELVYRFRDRQAHPDCVERIIYTMLMSLVVVALAVTTFRRNLDYASDETIWLDTAAKRPGNIRAYVNLSGHYLLTGESGKAIEYCNQALKHLPDFSKISGDALNPMIHGPDVERRYREVSFYSRIQNNYGLALQQQGRLDEAIAHFKEGIRLVPNNVAPQVNLACISFGRGQRIEAVAMLRHAIELEPGNPSARECLGNALMFMGDTGSAVKSYEAILEIEPDNIRMLSKVAWILATDANDAVRDGSRAIALAEKAARAVDYKSWGALDTLAAAYAEAGRFDEAVKTASKASVLADPTEKRDIDLRVALYLQHKAYHRAGNAPAPAPDENPKKLQDQK
jgi:tetratricopeptide (TPR) repeat protein